MRDQEERFRVLFADGPAPQAFADVHGRLAAVNKAFLRLLGMTHVDVVGRPLLDLTHPDDRVLNSQLLRDLLDGRIGSFQIAKRYLDAEGRSVPVLNTVAIVEAAGERYVAAVALARPLAAAADEQASCQHEALWRQGFHHSALPQAYADSAGMLVDANAAFCELIGRPRTAVVGRTTAELSHRADSGEAERALALLLSGQADSVRVERVFRHASGRPIPVLTFANAVVVDGVLVGVTGYFEDLRVVRDAERRLEQQTQMLAALGERSRDAGLVVDDCGVLLYVSPAARGIFGYGPDDLLTRDAWEFVHPDDVGELHAIFDDLVSAGAGTRVHTCRVIAAGDDTRWVTVSMTNLLESPVGGVVCNVVDVSEQRELQELFDREQQRNRAIIDSLREGIWATDAAGNTLFANAKLAEILGLPLTTIYDCPADRLVGRDEEATARRHSRIARGDERYEVAYPHPDGQLRQLDVQATPFAYGDPPVMGSLATVTDVTAQRALEQELRDIALRDSLTGLPNRTLLMDRIERALQRSGDRVSLLLVDLDQFKLVNDARGHDVGDRVLVEVAARLRRLADPDDTVARLGGDEFVIVCEQDRTSCATELAAAVQHELQAPIAVEDHEVRVSVSIGIAAAPAPAATDLLRFADAAMFAAKSAGRARAHVFDRALAEEAERAYTLAADLQTALHSDGLVAHYQPVVELATGRVTAYEMLARWTHPVSGSIPPDVFIPLAERTGLTRSLDHWAIRRGITDAAALRANGSEAGVAINLSAQHLSDQDLEDYIVSTTAQAGVPARRLTFEITESAIMHDVTATLRLLARLRDRGYQIALDDFGTGHSSLAYLRDLPITALKIDRGFIADMTADDDARAIVTSIIHLARAVGVATVAEGVETIDQATELRVRGCTAGQGWLWSTAVPLDELGNRPRRYAAVGAGSPRHRPAKPPEPALTDEHGLLRLFELQREGASLTTIAAALNAEGYRTPTGNRWHRLTVARALADFGPGAGG